MTKQAGNTGHYCYGARYYDPKVSVWLSVDPEAARDPHMTPYHFVYNNPVMFVDPNGLHGYKADADGHITRIDSKSNPDEAASGGKDFDVLYNHNLSETMVSTFEPGTLSESGSFKEGGNTYTSFNIDNQQLADETFKFLAENGTELPQGAVEWSRMQYDDVEGYGIGSILSSSHDRGKEEYGPLLAKKYKEDYGFEVYGLDHSHATTKIFGYAGPSGYHIKDGSWGSEHNDVQSAKALEKIIPGINLRVYDVPSRTYVPYNSKGKIK